MLPPNIMSIMSYTRIQHYQTFTVKQLLFLYNNDDIVTLMLQKQLRGSNFDNQI